MLGDAGEAVLTLGPECVLSHLSRSRQRLHGRESVNVRSKGLLEATLTDQES